MILIFWFFLEKKEKENGSSCERVERSNLRDSFQKEDLIDNELKNEVFELSFEIMIFYVLFVDFFNCCNIHYFFSFSYSYFDLKDLGG